MSGFSFFTFVTGFGDQGVILPFAAAVAIALAASGARHEAMIWCGAISVALTGTLVAKIFFLPCGHLIPALDIRSPSGHTAAAIAAYGGFAVLWARLSHHHLMRIGFISAALAAGFAIAASRVAIGAHTTPEVLLGGLIGISAPAILAGIEPPASEPRPRPTLLLLLIPLALVLLLHGAALPVEGIIDRFSMRLMALIGICV
jgi:membrane-associated phospholipid phosphatase